MEETTLGLGLPGRCLDVQLQGSLGDYYSVILLVDPRCFESH